MHLIWATVIRMSNYYSILRVCEAAQLQILISFLIYIFKLFNFIFNCIFPNDGIRSKDFSNSKNYNFMKLDLLALWNFEDLRQGHI